MKKRNDEFSYSSLKQSVNFSRENLKMVKKKPRFEYLYENSSILNKKLDLIRAKNYYNQQERMIPNINQKSKDIKRPKELFHKRLYNSYSEIPIDKSKKEKSKKERKKPKIIIGENDNKDENIIKEETIIKEYKEKNKENKNIIKEGNKPREDNTINEKNTKNFENKENSKLMDDCIINEEIKNNNEKQNIINNPTHKEEEDIGPDSNKKDTKKEVIENKENQNIVINENMKNIENTIKDKETKN